MSIETIKKVYEYLEKVTPLNQDCGKICSNKCCKGGDSDGMVLFPGEETLFVDNENFLVYYDKKYGYNCVKCNAMCNRAERPLSCRIFPYFIYVKDKPVVAPDIRAKDFCPLLSDDHKINKKFLRALRISAKKLYSDEEIRNFLFDLTDMLTDFNSL